MITEHEMARRETADPNCPDCSGTGTVKLRDAEGELIACVCQCVKIEEVGIDYGGDDNVTSITELRQRALRRDLGK